MNQKKLQPTKIDEKLNILACELYFACYDPDIAQNKALLNTLKQALFIIENQTGNTSPHR
jgi:hypothetical protein